MKETVKKLDVTINDMVLAMSAGALRSLSLKYDGQADHPLLASVPVSFDFSKDRVSGNYFTGVMMVVPIELDDPLERVRDPVLGMTRAWKPLWLREDMRLELFSPGYIGLLDALRGC